MDTIRIRRGSAAAVLIALGVSCALGSTARAEDRWFSGTDPRKRAFLHWGDGPGGEARRLSFACLRDVDEFTVFTDAIFAAAPSGETLVLTLSRGAASLAVDGRGQVSGRAMTFEGGLPIDGRAERAALARSLAAVLKGSGPLVARLGGEAVTITTAPVDPKAWATFERICFGR